jgi:hypothetical protein
MNDLHETSTEQKSGPAPQLAKFHQDKYSATTYFPLYAPAAAPLTLPIRF